MRITLIIVFALMLSASPVYAKETEPAPKMPRWATEECLKTIERIVEHETGNMKDADVFRFMAEQVAYDIPRMGCDRLTQWRWKIGYFPYSRVSRLVRSTVRDMAQDSSKKHPRCQFVGYPSDVAVWESYGYAIKVDYQRSIGNLTVIGANCR